MRPHGDIPLGFCQCGCGQKTNISDRTRPAKGYVKGQPYPYIYNHSKSNGRLDNYVVEDRGYDTPCWIWQGTIDELKGYGSLKVNGKMVKAHRAMYEREVGPIPEGLELDHLCRVRSCVCPDHLEPVTGLVNIRRGRHVKLSESDVAEIKSLYGTVPVNELARRYSVHRSQIHYATHVKK